MTKRRIGRSPILLALIASAAAVTVVPFAPIRAQPSPAASPPAVKAAGSDADSLAESKLRIREDLSLFDAKLKAKTAQLRAADLRVKLYQNQIVNVQRQQKKGIASGANLLNAELPLRQAEANRESRSAELVEIQLHRDRAKRRSARMEQGFPDSTRPETGRASADDRIERLEYEMEQVLQNDDSRSLPTGR